MRPARCFFAALLAAAIACPACAAPRALFGFLTLGKTTAPEVRAVFEKAQCPVGERDNIMSVPRGCLSLPGAPSAQIEFSGRTAEAITLTYEKEDFFPGAETFPQYFSMMNEWLGKPRSASRSLFGGGRAAWSGGKLSAELIEPETSLAGTLTIFTERYAAALRKKELLQELKNKGRLTPL